MRVLDLALVGQLFPSATRRANRRLTPAQLTCAHPMSYREIRGNGDCYWERCGRCLLRVSFSRRYDPIDNAPAPVADRMASIVAGTSGFQDNAAWGHYGVDLNLAIECAWLDKVTKVPLNFNCWMLPHLALHDDSDYYDAVVA